MSDAPNLPVLGITAGDLNGIGLEIIIKTLADPELLELCVPVVLASAKVAAYHRNAIDRKDFNFHIVQDIGEAQPGKANLLNCWNEEVPLSLGQASSEVGAYAVHMLEKAVALLREGKLDGLVTAPIHKKNIQSDKFPFTGHTDYLEDRFGGRSLMLMLSDEMRMALATVHIPLAEVSPRITEELVYQRIADLHQILRRDFQISKGRIAVLALNPHAGDEGVMGEEDQQKVLPAIQRAFQDGYLAFGPYPADGFFGSAKYREFDVVLALYHDQGLIPFKALSFGQGVNYTAGLSIVRTSPDHGTAFDIAGDGVAEPSSFRQALFSALQLVRNRKQSQVDEANPLEVKVRKKSR